METVEQHQSYSGKLRQPQDDKCLHFSPGGERLIGALSQDHFTTICGTFFISKGIV